MESTQPQRISAAKFAPVNDKSATPFSQQTMVLTKQDYIELKWEANYWRGEHARPEERGAALRPKLGSLEATNRDATARVYGAKGGKTAGPDHVDESPPLC